MNYTVRFYSNVGQKFVPKVTIKPKDAYDGNEVVATLEIGEFAIPLDKDMAEQLHQQVHDVLENLLFPVQSNATDM